MEPMEEPLPTLEMPSMAVAEAVSGHRKLVEGLLAPTRPVRRLRKRADASHPLVR